MRDAIQRKADRIRAKQKQNVRVCSRFLFTATFQFALEYAVWFSLPHGKWLIPQSNNVAEPMTCMPEKKKKTQVRLLIVHSIATAYTCAKSRREKVFIPVIAATNCKATRRYKVLISVDFLVSFEFSFGRTHRFLEYFALHTQRLQRVCASLVHSRQHICANCC